MLRFRARGAVGEGIAATLAKRSYLGSGYEYSFDTALGAIFVVSPELAQVLPIGAQVGLSLGQHGVSVVQTK